MGKDSDPATGLYYFNARWYDAELGRFITEDPARDGGNWYQYARRNPLVFVDPSGLRPWWHYLIPVYGQIVGIYDTGVVIGDALEAQARAIVSSVFANRSRLQGGSSDQGFLDYQANVSMGAALNETIEAAALVAGKSAGVVADLATGAMTARPP